MPPFLALAEQGIPERELWRATWANREPFDPVWDMVLEHSTGFSGAFARQVTLSQASLTDEVTLDLVQALEQSAREEAIILTGHGVMMKGDDVQRVSLRYDGQAYGSAKGTYTREELVEWSREGKFVGTLTGHHGVKTDVDHPQPAIWTPGPIHEQSGPQEFPKIHSEQLAMTLSGRHVDENAHIILDGRRTGGKVSVLGDEVLTVELLERPTVGMHLLQLQTPGGLISNDFIFHVTEEAEPERAPTLGELVRNHGWEELLGDWVDVGTRGEFRMNLNWRLKNQLLELSFSHQDGPTIASIRIDPDSGEVAHLGVNPNGTGDFQPLGLRE